MADVLAAELSIDPDEYAVLFPEKQSEDAVGIPDRRYYGYPDQIPAGTELDLVIKRHLARKAGPHFDFRIGDKDRGLHSWVTRKGLPGPGGRVGFFHQPVHSWRDRYFAGTIPSGYGAGTVSIHDEGRILVTKTSPNFIHFTRTDKKHPERFVLFKPERKPGRKDDWLLVNVTPTKALQHEKVRYTKVPAADVEDKISAMKSGDTVAAKIDGASSLVQLLKDRVDVVSYRAAKQTGFPILHTERMFGGKANFKIPQELQGSVLKGELFGMKGDKVIPPQELGGILNATVANSLQAQRDKGVTLKNLLYDIQQYGKQHVDLETTPREERLQMLKRVMQSLPADKFQLSEAVPPEGALDLWKQIGAGKHPLTTEGIVGWPSTGRPWKAKITDDYDVHITGVFPGEGKYHGVGAGGFEYALEPGGQAIGRVGCVEVGTVVSCSEGIQPINAVTQSWQVASWTGDTVSLRTVSHYHPAKSVIGVELETVGGFRIAGSANHPLLGKNLEFRQMSDLAVGDWLAIAAPHVGTAATIRLHGLLVDSALSYVIGLYIAEGCRKTTNVKHNSYAFAVADSEQEMTDRLLSYFGTEFPAKSVIYRHDDRTRAGKVTVTSEAFSWVLRQLGLRDCRAREKFIPGIFWTSRDCLSAMLRGLFDGDGCCILDPKNHGYGPALATASRRLACDTQLALLGLGVFSSVVRAATNNMLPSGERYCGTKYTVRVSSAEAVAGYAQHVGFDLPAKQCRLRSCLVAPNRTTHGNSRVPISPELVQRQAALLGLSLRQLGSKLPQQFNSYNWQQSGCISRGALSAMVHYLRSQGVNTEEIDPYLSLFWVPVRKIRERAMDVVDLTVPGTHNYWSAGFVSHNTGFSDETRRDMWSDPSKYVGRVARIRSQQQLESGAYRAPSFLALHEDITPASSEELTRSNRGEINKSAEAANYTVADSQIHGKGVFAAHDFAVGDKVGVALARRTDSADGKVFARTELGRFVNYQPVGNVGLVEEDSGDLSLVAIAPIVAGDEMVTRPYDDELLPWEPYHIVDDPPADTKTAEYDFSCELQVCSPPETTTLQ